MMRGPLKFLNRDEDDVLGMAELKIQKLMLELCFMLASDCMFLLYFHLHLACGIYSGRERNCIGKSVAVQIWIHYFVHNFSAKTPLEIPQSLMLLNRQTCICHSSRTIGWKLTPVFIGFIVPIRSAAPRDEKCLGGKKKAKEKIGQEDQTKKCW